MNLNAYKKKGKDNGPSPVIEILDDDSSINGEIVVLQVLRRGEI